MSSAYKLNDTPCLENKDSSGSMYKEKSVGARIDQCGIPQERCATEEVCFPIHTENFLLVTYD